MSEAITTRAGVTMPAIVYGTAWKEARTAGLVEEALAAGFRGIDTACQPKHYNEPGVGQGLSAAFGAGVERSAVYVQTKFTPTGGHDPARIPYDPRAPLAEQVAQSIERSRTNLPVETLDGLVLHSPLETFADTMTVWRALEAAVDAGHVRQLGISNCYDLALFKRLFAGARIPPAVLQNRFYRDSGYDVALRAFCKDQGVVYQSFWTLTANPDLLASDAVRTACATHTKTPAQVLYRALTQLGIVPLIGTTSRQHMNEDLAIFSFTLSRHELSAIKAFFE
ncbi:MAG: aldo/keto reductase [Myxococcota bacterium]